MLPHEFGVFVRSAAQLDRARAAVKEAGIAFKILDEHVETTSGHVSISTMHLAKGLEFRAVVVMACDDEIIPLQERIETVGDDADLQEVYDTERHLLYVACTRARDHLLVTGVDPVSEFLDDFVKGRSGGTTRRLKWTHSVCLAERGRERNSKSRTTLKSFIASTMPGSTSAIGSNRRMSSAVSSRTSPPLFVKVFA